MILLISGSIPPMKCGVGGSTRLHTTPLGSRDDLRMAVLTDGSFKDAPIPNIGSYAVDGSP